MENAPTPITVTTTVQLPPALAWELFTNPMYITQWNFASPEWHTPHATMDLRPGGQFLWRMEAKDGSAGFDFTGTFTEVSIAEKLAYTMPDGRKVAVHFFPEEGGTRIEETFDPENTHSRKMQQEGWQAILENYRAFSIRCFAVKKLTFSVSIQAPLEKVYHTMLDDAGYRQWTSVFNPHSHFTGSWDKGAEIRFMGADENGHTGGMISRIAEHIPLRFVSIEHCGMIENGKDIMEGPQVDMWKGAHEDYAFAEENGVTTVTVMLDTAGGFETYMAETYPKALEKLKSICEG